MVSRRVNFGHFFAVQVLLYLSMTAQSIRLFILFFFRAKFFVGSAVALVVFDSSLIRFAVMHVSRP